MLLEKNSNFLKKYYGNMYVLMYSKKNLVMGSPRRKVERKCLEKYPLVLLPRNNCHIRERQLLKKFVVCTTIYQVIPFSKVP